MWNPFKRQKLDIYSQFLADMVRQGSDENFDQIKKNLKDTPVPVDQFELRVFSAFLPYHAIILAEMPLNVKSDYVSGVARTIFERFPDSRDSVELRFNEYNEASALDMKAQVTESVHPSQRKLVGAAVNNVTGVTDSRSEFARYLFATQLGSTYSATVPFLTDDSRARLVDLIQCLVT